MACMPFAGIYGITYLNHKAVGQWPPPLTVPNGFNTENMKFYFLSTLDGDFITQNPQIWK